MKTFLQAVTDYKDETRDSSAANETRGKRWMNSLLHKILALKDFNFNRTQADFTTEAETQGIPVPYNIAKIDDVFVYFGSTWYTPKEIKVDEEWRRLNSSLIYSDIPEFWFFNKTTKEVELFPIPSAGGGTARIKGTKKIRDLGAAAYVTGTVTTTANSSIIQGSGTAFTAIMAGRHIKITGTNTILDDMWFEIESVTDADTIVVKENIPVAAAGASYTINEMIPLPDGFEEIPFNGAVAKYYDWRRRPEKAKTYWRQYEDDKEEMISRDLHTINDLFEKSASTHGYQDPNQNPFNMEVTSS